MAWLRRILVAFALISLVAACKPKKPPAPKPPATVTGALEEEEATLERELEDEWEDDEASDEDDEDDAP